jgi:two-component system, NarL family, sensor histidine kinase UhpB
MKLHANAALSFRQRERTMRPAPTLVSETPSLPGPSTMSLPNSTELAQPAERAPGSPATGRVPAEHHERSNISLLWRVFAANAAVLLAAFALLVWSPVTIHAHIRLAEVVLLVVGLLVMLACDLLLVRGALGPLRTLAATMSAVDPMRPGRRATLARGAGSEVLALARACNGMLDRLETERRESARRALAAQEAERLRIARELHDEVGQGLTAMLLGLAPIAKRASVELSEDLTQVLELARASLDDVRRLAMELRPEALDDLGLVNALLGLCSRVEQQGHLRVRRELASDLPPLSAEVELVVYRVAQEALTNALRHSQAKLVSVSLASDDGRVVLRIADDGRGLPESLPEGSGLAGMRERAMLVGADLQISSRENRGVEVKLVVAPVQGEH